MKFAALILFLGLALSVSAQTKKPPLPPIKPKRTVETIQADIVFAKQTGIQAAYDRFDNETTVVCRIDKTLWIAFKFKGRELTQTANKFIVQANTLDEGSEFSANRRLQFIADGKRSEFTGGYGATFDRESNKNREFLIFEIDKKILESIASSKQTDYRVGKNESYLVRSEKDKIKFFISLLTAY